MPKQRLQVDGPDQLALRPAAAPTDPFVATNAGAQAEKLAQSLATLSPSVGRLSDVVAGRQAQADYTAGIARADELARSKKSFADAVKAGTLLPAESPWFMAGLHEQFGRLSADRWQSDFMTAAAQDEKLRTSTDMADFDAFAQKHLSDWMKANLGDAANNPYFSTGFNRRSDAYLSDLRRQFAAQAADRAVSQGNEAQHSEIMNSVVTEMGRGTPLDQIASSIKQLSDSLVAQGRNGHDVNVTTVEAVVDAARRLNDMNVLGLLDKIPGGTEGSQLSMTSYGAKAIEDAKHDIAVAANARYAAEWALHERQQQQLIDQTFSDFATASQHGTVDATPFIARLTAAGAADKIPTLLGVAAAIRNNQYVDDPRTVASLFTRIHFVENGQVPTSVEEASRDLGQHRITVDTYNKIVTAIDTQHQQDADPVKNDPALSRARTELYQMFVDEYGMNTQETRIRGGDARDQLVFDYLQWQQGEGKTATPTQAQQWYTLEKHTLFARFADRSNALDGDVGAVNLPGPQIPDPSKQPIALPSNITALEHEWEDIKAGRRAEFSPQSLFILHYAHIAPAGIDAFIQSQKQLFQLVPPDSSGVQ